MRTLLLAATLGLCLPTLAIDRFVDPNLSSGNGTTLFNSIASAVTASVNGDRILIVPGTYDEPALTLNKSLTLMGQTAGSTVNFNANITVAGFPGMKLQLLGFNLGIYNLNSSAVTGGSATNRAKVSLIECSMANLSLDNDYYEFNGVRTVVSTATTFRFGAFVASKTGTLTITDEPGNNVAGQSIFICNDTITSTLWFQNDDSQARIYNNRLIDLRFIIWQSTSGLQNMVCNNDFVNGAYIHMPWSGSIPRYNFTYANNQFLGTIVFSTGFVCGDANNYSGVGFGCLQTSASSSAFPNAAYQGLFEWIYNGVNLPCATPTAGQPLVLTRVIGPTGTTANAGSPNNAYYDTDLTVNDRGRTGGPYSSLNYNPTLNPSGGKAFIIDLEMPSDLFPGQQLDIKAKGYHRN